MPVASKGAEKLTTPHLSAATSPENAAQKSKPAEAPVAALRNPDANTSAPVAELIVRGPPHTEEPRSLKKVFAWIGLAVLGVVIAGLVTLYLRRRPEPVVESEPKQEFDPLRADGILTKEPLNQP